jgi:hypothetical protein
LGRKSGSYKFEKRQKELKKQKKKREKLERRQNKGEFDDEPQPTMDFGDAVEGSSEPETDTEAETDPTT